MTVLRATHMMGLATAASLLSGCMLVQGSTGASQQVVALEGAYICTPDDRAHIAIAPGALTEDLVITIRPIGVPDGVGDLQVIEPVFDFGPSGTRFAQPVWIQLHPTVPEGIALSDLSLFSQSGGVVEELSDVSVDESSGTISGWTTHFSAFFAAYAGPRGGRGIRVGGRGLMPLFGSSSQSTSPPNVDLWFSRDGTVTSQPYTGIASDVLVIQIDTDPVAAETKFYVEGWTIDPIDPERPLGPTGDLISTRGFWHDFFAGEIELPLKNALTDSQGRLVVAFEARHLYARMLMAPAGYSSGRLRLRIFAEGGPEAVDIILNFGRLD